VPGSCSHSEEKTIGNKAYSGGELRTKYNNFRYGRYEARFKSPSIQPGNTTINGGYVATFFLFHTPKFTEWREIDLEQTGDGASALTTNLINGDDKPGWDASFTDAIAYTLPFNSRQDFHTYALEWTSASITWFVDDQQIRQQVGASKLPIPALSTKIIMNLWFGGFGGDPGNNVLPLTTEYDWVRFYKWNNETTYPCSPTPSCLPAGDLDGSKNNFEDGVPDIPPDGVPDVGCP
jgi:beta-glucanase (GH16 family)